MTDWGIPRESGIYGSMVVDFYFRRPLYVRVYVVIECAYKVMLGIPVGMYISITNGQERGVSVDRLYEVSIYLGT